MMPVANKALPEGQSPHYYFLRLLIAAVKQSGGQLVLDPNIINAVQEGEAIIPLWDGHSLTLRHTQEKSAIFVLGSEQLSQTSVAKSPSPSQQLEQIVRQPRSVVLDDAALLERERQQKVQANVRDLIQRGPQAVAQNG